MTKLTKLRATIESSQPVKNTTIIIITQIDHDQHDDHRHYYDHQDQPEERRMVESGQRRPCNRKSLSRGWSS